jgi:hypothetical protein
MFWISDLESTIGFGNTKNPMNSFALLFLDCYGGSDHILAIF